MKKIFLLSFLATSVFAQGPHVCTESKSPLFKADASDDLKIEIVADFDHINKTEIEDYKPYAPAMLSYVNADGVKEYVAMQIEARGNSRFSYCEWRPLKFTFEGEKYSKSIVDSVIPNVDNPTYMASLYEAMTKEKGVDLTHELDKKSDEYRMFVGVSNKKNVFKKLGKDIKVVTHCGNGSWFKNEVQILGSPEADE